MHSQGMLILMQNTESLEVGHTVQMAISCCSPLPAPNPSARKFPILQYLIAALQKLAATRNIAIVILSQCVTKMRSGIGAILVPSINVTAWEQGLSCRVALFRDWGWDDGDGKPVDDVRLAQVIKVDGVLVPESRPKIFGFTIHEASQVQAFRTTRS